jgi:CubicO group peptidase (beta-lactamase class C family)
MRKVAAFICLIPLLVTFDLDGQALNDSSRSSILHSLDELIKQTVESNDIPSISVGVIQNGEVTLQKGYGAIERGASKKVDEKTGYQIASLSKMFTGIIANSLILEG